MQNDKNELEKLKQELHLAREKNQVPPSSQPSNAFGLALRIISDLIAAIGVGTAIGYGLDYAIGTAPLFMVIFFFLGLAAGVFNVMKTAKDMNRRQYDNDENNSDI